jgi:hypothetical protein
VRDEVRRAVEQGIADLQVERMSDPARKLGPRLRREASRLTRAQAAAVRRILPFS